MSRILVVDDEPPIARTVAANLRARGHEAITVVSGAAALTAAETADPDCVVLDLGLPGLHGLEVLRRLRTWSTVPVVVLTATDAERDKVTAFDLDAKLVTRGGEPVHLTRTEYGLVEVLAANAGRLCTHRFLLERVWGPGYEQESQYLRVYMASLRKKLDDPSAPSIIVTEPGMGYRFVANEPSEQEVTS